VRTVAARSDNVRDHRVVLRRGCSLRHRSGSRIIEVRMYDADPWLLVMSAFSAFDEHWSNGMRVT
jgi:hypothetical protein